MAIQTQVLIIGGGFAGVSAAQALAKQGIKTTLVDKKDYFEVTFATLRSVADPLSTGNQARKYYQDFLAGDFIQGSVVEMTAQQAVFTDGTEIEFEIGIIASGTRYPSLPLAKSESAVAMDRRNSELLSEYSKLKAANKVLVIGGGIVGVELAGEIAHAHPNKKVILAHNSDILLPGFKEKAQRKAQQQLKKLNVEIQFNRRYQQQDDQYVDQNTGEVAGADLVYQATGVLPNNNFLIAKLGHILNDHGFVKVDKKLQVEGEANLYALGDIADVGEAKLGYLAVEQGKYLAKLIGKKQKGKGFKGYKRNPLMALIPVGKEQGIVQLPFAVTTAGFLVGMKQKDLFINKIYTGFGTRPNNG